MEITKVNCLKGISRAIPWPTTCSEAIVATQEGQLLAQVWRSLELRAKDAMGRCVSTEIIRSCVNQQEDSHTPYSQN
jgi:hypothetical protein